MKGERLSYRYCTRGMIADSTYGSKVAADGGYEFVTTEAACGDESLMELVRLRVLRAW